MGTIRLSTNKLRKIQAANIISYPNGSIHPDRVMDCHDFFLMETGGWEVLENGTIFCLKPWDVLFLFKGRHHWGEKLCVKNTRTPYIHISSEDGDQFFPNEGADLPPEGFLHLSSVMHLRPDDLHIKGLFEDIVYSFWSHSSYNHQRAIALVSLLLIELARRTNREKFNPAVMPVLYVMDVLERNPGRHYSLDDLAEMVSLNTRVLTKRFRNVAGVSIKQFQLRHRIRVACSILESMPSTTFRSIAETLGFADEYHFSHCFKSINGISPAAYRRGMPDTRPKVCNGELEQS